MLITMDKWRTPTKMAPTLEAVGLTKRFGQFTAVSDLSLRLEGTKCVGFLGPNGAGKTTTMKIFTGLISASRGSVMVNGVDVSKDKKSALASCSALIETPEMYPSLTAKEALMMLSEIRGVPREERSKQIDEAIARVKMQEWENKKVGSFSKGMKQRVNVASTLLGDPDVIILDEPTIGLDPRGMSEVRDIVKSLGSRLVFMSSHLLAEVTEVCQEVALIDHGKLLVYDTIGSVTAKFSGSGGTVEVAFSRDLEEAARGRIGRLEGVQSVTMSNGKKANIRFAGGDVAQERLFRQIAEMGIGAISFRETSAGLEDAYLKLVKETL
jgi:ABC-2 type transport system ATP-binding protein